MYFQPKNVIRSTRLYARLITLRCRIFYKMAALFSLTNLFFSPIANAGTPKCFNNEMMPGKDEMMISFVDKDYDNFVSKFKQVCDVYKERLVCKTERVSRKKAMSRMNQLISRDHCAEALRVETSNAETIYFMTTKKEKKTHSDQ